MEQITPGKSRPETPEEAFLREWFEEHSKKSIDNLEAGARQIITLVGTFYGIIFAVLALGSDKFEASLHHGAVIAPGIATVLALLGAVVSALVVVLPIFRYGYNPSKPADEKKVYEEILARKSGWLRAAVVLFGVGLATFAWLIAAMMVYR